ncbi:hypothetical protein [Actinomadura madurae]|uniref:hypothetical protein n=1 Tax=Actinomadura madurae TaxID=1993 RepID=UPI0020D24336|nr:hypothetical protein [Actinomadura madurae]MCP9985278.1 hypothetical protein [Actinomadura madurae]
MTLTAKTSNGKNPPAEQMDQAVKIMTQRVNGLGVSDAEVTKQGSNNIVVNVPGEGQGRVVNLIGTTAKLQFRQVFAVADGRPSAGGAPSPSASPSTKGQGGKDEGKSPSPSASASPSGSPSSTPRGRALSGALTAPTPSPSGTGTPSPSPSASSPLGQPSGQPGAPPRRTTPA